MNWNRFILSSFKRKSGKKHQDVFGLPTIHSRAETEGSIYLLFNNVVHPIISGKWEQRPSKDIPLPQSICKAPNKTMKTTNNSEGICTNIWKGKRVKWLKEKLTSGWVGSFSKVFLKNQCCFSDCYTVQPESCFCGNVWSHWG